MSEEKTLEQKIEQYFETDQQIKKLTAIKDPLNKSIKAEMKGSNLSTITVGGLVATYSIEERSNMNEQKLMQRLKTLGFTDAIEKVERPNQVVIEQLLYEKKITPEQLSDCVEVSSIEKLMVKVIKPPKKESVSKKVKGVVFDAKSDKSVF